MSRGHIVKRSAESWRIVVSNGFDSAGRHRQVTKTIKGTKRDANQALTSMLRDLDQGSLKDGRQQLGTYLTTEWIPAVASVSKRGKPLAPTTLTRYEGSAKKISDVIGKVRLLDLRAEHPVKLRDSLLADGLAPQTVSDQLRVLSQALGYAEAQGHCRNWAAAAIVNRPVGEKPRFTVIDAELGGKILAAVRGTDPWDIAATLGLGLGLRREEVLGLRWSDNDEGVVHIRQTLTYAAGELHYGRPKSEAGERDLQLPAFVAAALKRHKAQQAKRLLALGITPTLVVDRGDGEPWMPASFSTGWRRFAKAHGFEGVKFHGLRHGAATLMLASGISDAVAANVMGHADTRILARYQDVVTELQRDAAARMDGLLGRGSSL